MGGGGDSRIPRLLDEALREEGIRVVVRTYDFDPEVGYAQISGWVRELAPDLVIGESLGAVQAMRVRGIPHLYVSPALGAPRFLYRTAWVTRLPGGSGLLRRIWPVKEGDRQPLRFEYGIMRKYKTHWVEAEKAAREGGFHFAFFGTHDHYKRWGVVRIRTWREMFGNTFQEYEGTHFMEEEYVFSMLIPKIREVLNGTPKVCSGD